MDLNNLSIQTPVDISVGYAQSFASPYNTIVNNFTYKSAVNVPVEWEIAVEPMIARFRLCANSRKHT